jgi:uncharacterized membrane protein
MFNLYIYVCLYAIAGGETKIVITWHITCVSESVFNALMAKNVFQFQDKTANI